MNAIERSNVNTCQEKLQGGKKHLSKPQKTCKVVDRSAVVKICPTSLHQIRMTKGNFLGLVKRQR